MVLWFLPVMAWSRGGTDFCSRLRAASAEAGWKARAAEKTELPVQIAAEPGRTPWRNLYHKRNKRLRRRFGIAGLVAYNAGMPAESISARLSNVVLPEAGGGELRLGSLWEGSSAVVVFLRHYG